MAKMNVEELAVTLKMMGYDFTIDKKDETSMNIIYEDINLYWKIKNLLDSLNFEYKLICYSSFCVNDLYIYERK
jgi:hypothetical protein